MHDWKEMYMLEIGHNVHLLGTEIVWLHCDVMNNKIKIALHIDRKLWRKAEQFGPQTGFVVVGPMKFKAKGPYWF